MLKLNKLADYATVLLATMAAAPERQFSGAQLSEQTGLPATTVAKLLKTLVRGGILCSTRGAGGGYRLSRPPRRISVADVVVALDGPVALTDCAPHGSGCAHAPGCRSRNSFRLIDQAIRHALEAVTLDQMARPGPAEAPLHFLPHPPRTEPLRSST